MNEKIIDAVMAFLREKGITCVTKAKLRSACRFLGISTIPDTYSDEAKAIIKKALAKGWDRYSI